MKFGTKAVHAGVEPDPLTGSVMTPIYQTSTYAQEAPGKHKGYEYARTQNPTREALEASLAALENATHAICYASGLAAMDAILKRLEPGDEIISTNDLYGGSYRLIRRVYEKYGIKAHFIDLMSEEAFAEALNENTKLIWVETPTNPMLNVVDIQSVVERTKGSNALVCVDNTFASPYLQTPLDLGADMVLHSATKYINGHSDVILGAVVVKDDKLAEDFRFLQNASGAVPSPNDCFLTLRGIKTLHLRVEQSCKSAAQIAEVLRVHPKVANVYWPGFKTHKGHEIAKAQMKRFGGMVSFDLVEDSLENATKILSGTKLFTLAESLGGVESLIGHPATMTHASIPREERLAVGLTDSLIRLSVGVEDTSDLVEDLAIALSKI